MNRTDWIEIERSLQDSWLELLDEALGGIPGLALVRPAQGALTESERLRLSPEQREREPRLRDPGRRLEWSQARRCEWEIRSRLGAGAMTSIAHARREELPVVFAVGASVDPPGSRTHWIGRIGIDAEPRARAVSDALARKLVRPEEERIGIEPLGIWVIKEALFKADPLNAGTAVSAHSILEFDPASGRGRGRIAQREAEFRLLSLEDWSVALAVSRSGGP